MKWRRRNVGIENGRLGREKLTGHAAESVAFATEAPYLQQLGMDVVVLGPGDIDVAHQPNEFLPLDRVQPTINFLSQLIGRCCL